MTKLCALIVMSTLLAGSTSATARQAEPAQSQAVQAAPEARALTQARLQFAKATQGPGGPTGVAALTARFTLANLLFGAGAYVEAEAEYRQLESVLATRLDVGDRNLLLVRQRLAESLIGQERWIDVVIVAEPAYAQATAAVGADHAIADTLRLSLASAFYRLGRYSEAEPLARASFDLYRRSGREQEAADIAATLADIYRRLDRPDQARAILRLVDSGDALRALINAANRAETPETQSVAWRNVLDATPDGDESRDAVEGKLISVLSNLASSRDDPAPRAEAIDRARAMVARAHARSDTDLVDVANYSLAVALLSGTPGVSAEDAREGLGLIARQISLTEAAHGVESREALDQRLYYAMSAATTDQDDLALAQVDRIQAVIASQPNILKAQDQAFVLMTRAGVLARQQDRAGAYHAAARAAEQFRAVALQRTDGTRSDYIREWSDIFDLQVKWGWRYAEALTAGTAGGQTD